MGTKQEIFKEKLAAYLAGDKAGKGEILDAVCTVTSCHRKAAVRRFATLQMRDTAAYEEHRGRKTVYGSAVTDALRELWEMMSRICAERLHDEIPAYVHALARDGMWNHDDTTTASLLKMSVGTMKARIAVFERT